MDDKLRQNIIRAYGLVLERHYSFTVGPESKLPFPKDLIRRAIVEAFLEETDPDQRNTLEHGYIELEAFLPDEEFELVQACHTALFSLEPLEKSSNPEDHERARQIVEQLPSRRFKEIQENISKRMSERLKDLQALRRIVGLPEE